VSTLSHDQRGSRAHGKPRIGIQSLGAADTRVRGTARAILPAGPGSKSRLKGDCLGFGRSWHAGDRLVWQAMVPAGGLSGRLFGFGLSWGGLSGCSRLLAGFLGIVTIFSGFAAQHLRDTKLEKFVAYQEGGLKPAAG